MAGENDWRLKDRSPSFPGLACYSAQNVLPPPTRPFRRSPRQSFVQASRRLRQEIHEARNTNPFSDDLSRRARARSWPCRSGSDTFSRYRTRQLRSILWHQTVRVDVGTANLAGDAARVLREYCRQNSSSRTRARPLGAIAWPQASDEIEA
jgi:hypothetical protein